MKKIFLLFFIHLFLCSLSASDLVWKESINVEIAGSPACYKEKIVIGSKAGVLFCIHPDGSLLWKQRLKGSIMSPPSIDKRGNIYVGTTAKMLYCFSIDGKKNWKLTLDDEIRSTPLLRKDTLYIADMKGTFVAINKKTRRISWEKDLGYPVFSSAVFSKDKRKIIVPTKDNHLFSIDVTGNINWRFRCKGVIFSVPAITPDDEIYLTSMDHHLYKLSQKGHLIWRFKVGRWIICSPVLDSDGNVYFGSYDRHFYSLTPTGRLRWKIRGKGSFNATPVIDSSGNIYTGNSSGTVYAFTKDGKIIWKRKTPDYIRQGLTILSPRKLLIVCSIDGWVYAFKISNKMSRQAWWPKYLGNDRNSGFK